MFSKRYSIVIFLLLFSVFSVFADDGLPPDADDGGDPPAASIDENIYVLFFIGIVVAFLFFRYNKSLKLKSIEE